jgi:hypothetical protein
MVVRDMLLVAERAGVERPRRHIAWAFERLWPVTVGSNDPLVKDLMSSRSSSSDSASGKTPEP